MNHEAALKLAMAIDLLIAYRIAQMCANDAQEPDCDRKSRLAFIALENLLSKIGE